MEAPGLAGVTIQLDVDFEVVVVVREVVCYDLKTKLFVVVLRLGKVGGLGAGDAGDMRRT